MYREDQLKALLVGKRILIAGYGREGQSAERLIRRLVPEADYRIADGSIIVPLSTLIEHESEFK